MAKENKRMNVAKFGIIFAAVVGVLMTVITVHYVFIENVHYVEKEQMRGAVQVMEYEHQTIEAERAPLGIKDVYTMQIGKDVDSSESIAFFAIHQYVDVYIDNKLVYSLKKSDSCDLGKTAGTNWINVGLGPSQAGKEMKIYLTPVYKSAVDQDMEFLVGPQIEIVLEQLRSDWVQVALSILVMFAGLVFVIIAVMNFRQKNAGDNLVSLGCFALMIGIWKFTDIGLCFIMWPEKTIVFFYVSISMLMFMPVPILKAMKSFFSPRLHRAMDISCIISVSVALVQILMQFMNIMDIRETLFVTHIVIAANSIFGIGCFLYEKVRVKRAGKVGVGRIMFALCASGAVADLIMYYIKGTSFGLVFTVSAFLVYVVVVGFQIAFDYFRKQNELLEKEIELAESRIDLMVSQIQPHFLYNAITSIMAICMQSSERAVAALADFADYLRGNLDSLQSEKLIPFTKELHHVESYLRLEKLRFPDKLEIIYDIEVTDFMVPTLVVQPLVENAVKHGIGQKEMGGVLKLITRELGDHILIIVEDTGAGFDPNIKKDDGRNHYGMENVKKRVSVLNHGEMDVISEVEKGTRVTLKLPKYI